MSDQIEEDTLPEVDFSRIKPSDFEEMPMRKMSIGFEQSIDLKMEMRSR